MNISKQIIESIESAQNIVITAHKSPDGDSIGSSIAMLNLCEVLGKSAVICHPDPAPDFLLWLPKTELILNYEFNQPEIENAFNQADLILCLDYNEPKRVGDEMSELVVNSKAKKVLIDHHLNPADFTDITYSDPTVGSTCELIFRVLEDAERTDLLTIPMGTAIYLGIMTDTGSFRFPSVHPRTHSILAQLLEVGVKHYEVHQNVFDTNTLDRLKLRGYATSEKLELIHNNKVAIISLTKAELSRLNYIKGDTEGLVNAALSIQGVKAAAFFNEGDGYIKISFRSKGKENAVNVMTSDYFQGGGHANAAGGKFDGTMEDAIALFKKVVGQYIQAD